VVAGKAPLLETRSRRGLRVPVALPLESRARQPSAFFQMLDAAFVSLFHSFEQVLHLTSPWRRILPVRYGRGLSLSHTRNVLGFAHSPPHALHLLVGPRFGHSLTAVR
jgi:hypothetical protein